MIVSIIPLVSLRYVIAIIFSAALILLGLFLINKITFYLFVNTVFILLAVILALFFSFSSIKRDWQDQVGTLFKRSKVE